MPLQFPKEIVCVILDFEGSLIRAWKLDYIQSIYIEAYKRYFGKETTFKKICKPKNYLPLYTHFAKWMHHDNMWIRRRPSRKHMKPWRCVFGPYCEKLDKRAIKHSQYCENVLQLMRRAPSSLRITVPL